MCRWLYYCASCEPGSYCEGSKGGSASAATLKNCPSGHYSDYGQTVCTPCPPGTYTKDGLVQGDLSICLKCPPGTYQPYYNVSSAGK